MGSTRSRTYLAAIVIFLVALLLLGWVLQLFTEDYLAKQAFSRLENHAQLLSDLTKAYLSQGSLYSMQYLFNLEVACQAGEIDALICDPNGKILLCSNAPLGCEHQGITLKGELITKAMSRGSSQDTGMLKDLYPETRYVLAQNVRSGDAAIAIVLVSMPTAQTTAMIDRISDTFLLAALAVSLLTVVALAHISGYLSNPLQEMAKTASAFGHGDLDARVRLDKRQPKEVEELALAFNNMASSLQKSEYQRQEFVANVSHELKTPMTTIGGYVDGILDGTIPPEKCGHYMRIVSDETKRLSRLVRSMLDISQLQSDGIPEEKKLRFDLEEAVGQVLITFEQKINAKDLQVEVDMPEHPVFTMANQDYITQVIYNLLDNAVKFCPAGGTLGVRIREGGGKAYISISNDGQTIPPEELPLVFDRFHKLDKSRSQNRDGWGLGLYIVKTLVCSHGEDISVSSTDEKTEFTFTLPIAN